MSGTAKLYRIMRLDDEGFWTDMPGGGDFLDLFEAKHEALHYTRISRQRSKVVDQFSHCHMDSKTESMEAFVIEQALKEAGS